MGCIKNPKKFLFMRYFGGHDEKRILVGKFMVGVGDKFVVTYKCKACGAERKENFVTYDELLHKGMSNEEIEEAKLNNVAM